MANAMRKVAVYLGLMEDQDRYDDEYDSFDDDFVDDINESDEPDLDERESERREPANVASLADRRAGNKRRALATRDARITTLHPRNYNEARTLGEHFRDGTPVIMNLSEMEDSDAKRLVDFAAGLIFGLRGSIDRITAKVFLLTPADVRVTAEDKARLAGGGGFFNQS